jgi:hypothetical protein
MDQLKLKLINSFICLQYCDYCEKGIEGRSHPAENAIDGSERWWQSPPLSRGAKYNEINLTIDLGQVGSFNNFHARNKVQLLPYMESCP